MSIYTSSSVHKNILVSVLHFQKSGSGIYKQLWDGINMDLSNNIVQSGVEGIGKVKKGKFALIGTFSICFRVSCNVCLECIKYATRLFAR